MDPASATQKIEIAAKQRQCNQHGGDSYGGGHGDRQTQTFRRRGVEKICNYDSCHEHCRQKTYIEKCLIKQF